MNFRGAGHPLISTNQLDKMNHKKEFYDPSSAIQSIKSELLSNNTTLSASAKVFDGQEPIGGSYDDEDYNNENNIDVETDSDTDQQITELKQMTYHTLSDATAKHEEWSKIVKSTVMLKSNPSPKIVERIIASANDSTFHHTDDVQQITRQHDKKVCSSAGEVKIDADPDLDASRTNLKRVYIPDEDDNEYFNESFTNHNLLNLSERKRGKYGNGKGFSIENLIGRMVEDR